MTAFTPDTIRNIAKYAGVLPPHEIATRLGFTLSFVERTARDQGLDLRLSSERPEPIKPAPEIHRHRIRPEDRRTGNFSVNLRPADMEIIREKAAARFVRPGRLLGQIVEGAIARGKVDELASAASFHPRGAADAEPQVE